MKRLLTLLALLVAYTQVAYAQTYSIQGLSTQEILIIGAGLDKLPREVTDQNNLYQRIQAQITQQNQAFAKAQVDAQKAATDKAIADAIAEKAKADEKSKAKDEPPSSTPKAEPPAPAEEPKQ
jgi:uncharacterized membrane protein YcjF (UPF0283 family)